MLDSYRRRRMWEFRLQAQAHWQAWVEIQGGTFSADTASTAAPWGMSVGNDGKSYREVSADTLMGMILSPFA